jgi:hypothetical protein
MKYVTVDIFLGFARCILRVTACAALQLLCLTVAVAFLGSAYVIDGIIDGMMFYSLRGSRALDKHRRHVWLAVISFLCAGVLRRIAGIVAGCVCVRPSVCTPFDEVSLWFDAVEFLLVSAWQVAVRSIRILGRFLVLSASLAR